MRNNNQDLHAMRHSLAHIMASAIKRLWPTAKFGVGPVIDNGFYYDIDLGQSISDTDFAKIEAQMRKIIVEDQEFTHFSLPIDQAISWAREEQQPYKLELLNDLKRAGTTSAKDLDAAELGLEAEQSKVTEVSFYRNGDFTDLCRGPHVASTGKVGAFKLWKVSGAYWRGDQTRPQMQRLYGVAFATQKEVDEFFARQEEAKKRDHRILGKQLDLFTFSDLVGPGLPLFTPRGTIVRELLGNYSQQLQKKYGYQSVTIPHISKTDLYKRSGHYDKFPERFLVESFESNEEFMMKPMNCPHHTQIYASQLRSYRDLPLRYMENTMIYRDEKTGELHGLSRVRAATQDDGHVFARFNQIEEEFTTIMAMIDEMYTTFGLKIRARLGFRDDSDAYLGDKKVWQDAQAIIEKVAKKLELDYMVAEGDAAFYGPKIDILVADALGREWQLATEQLDFVQPERFGLSYINESGAEERPVMIHKALLGSLERFLSVYIEHTAGRFPFWLAPEQVRILTVNDSVNDYVQEVTALLNDVILTSPVKYNELRFSLDVRNESLGRKIRDVVEMKVPAILVVGPKDQASRQVSIRLHNKEQTIKLEELKNFFSSL